MLRGIIKKLRPDGDETPALHLAAFGKHPAWDDHIPDLGLDTDRLVHVKRVLYLDGIGRNIDSGAWESPGEGHGLPEFCHVFSRWEDQDWVMGRLWSSSDGKGRSRYPMVLCLASERVEFAKIATAAFDQLEEARQSCINTQSPAVVTSIVDNARDRLRAILNEDTASDRPDCTPTGRPDPLAVLAGHTDMGADHVGLTRLLYHVEREMSEYLPMSERAASSTKSGLVMGRAHHVRVPRCADNPIEALMLWSDFLRGRFLGRIPLWVICPLDGNWADLLVGPPTERELLCMRVPPGELPLPTDIPYSIDAEFGERVEEEIALSRGKWGETADSDR